MGKWKFRTIQQVISAVVVVASTYTRKYDKKTCSRHADIGLIRRRGRALGSVICHTVVE